MRVNNVRAYTYAYANTNRAVAKKNVNFGKFADEAAREHAKKFLNEFDMCGADFIQGVTFYLKDGVLQVQKDEKYLAEHPDFKKKYDEYEGEWWGDLESDEGINLLRIANRGFDIEYNKCDGGMAPVDDPPDPWAGSFFDAMILGDMAL